MKALFTVVLLFLIVLALVVAPGIGIGFLLYWILPAIELGTGILIGVVGTGFSLLFVARLLAAAEDEDETTVPEIVLTPVLRGHRGSRRKKASR